MDSLQNTLKIIQSGINQPTPNKTSEHFLLTTANGSLPPSKLIQMQPEKSDITFYTTSTSSSSNTPKVKAVASHQDTVWGGICRLQTGQPPTVTTGSPPVVDRLTSTPHSEGRQVAFLVRCPPDGAATVEETSSKSPLCGPFHPDDEKLQQTISEATSRLHLCLEARLDVEEDWRSSPGECSLPSPSSPVSEAEGATSSTPTPWLPPPPSTLLPFLVSPQDPETGPPLNNRYHEHMRSFELDCEAVDCQPAVSATATEADHSGQDAAFAVHPSESTEAAIDSVVAVSAPSSPDSNTFCYPRKANSSAVMEDRATVANLHFDCVHGSALPNGRSVVPWEATGADILLRDGAADDLVLNTSESLPQWIPPEHSEAAQRRGRLDSHLHLRPQLRPEEAQSNVAELARGPRLFAQASLHSSSSDGRHHSQAARRRHTTTTFAVPTIDAAYPNSNQSLAQQHHLMRLHSDGLPSDRTQYYRQNQMLMNDLLEAGHSEELYKKEVYRADKLGGFLKAMPVGYTTSSCGGPAHFSLDPGCSVPEELPSEASLHKSARQADIMARSMITSSGRDGEGQRKRPSGLETHKQPSQLSKRSQGAGDGLMACKAASSVPVVSPDRVCAFPMGLHSVRSLPKDEVMSQSVWLPHEVDWGPPNHRWADQHTSTDISPVDRVSSKGDVHLDYRQAQLATDMGRLALARTTQMLPEGSCGEHMPLQSASYIMLPSARGERCSKHTGHSTRQIFVPHHYTHENHPKVLPKSRNSSKNSSTRPVRLNVREKELLLSSSADSQRFKLSDSSPLDQHFVEDYPWFHGPISRANAESLLLHTPSGSFLVRTSETTSSAYSLSIRREDDFLHMKISYDRKSGAYILGEYSQPYSSIPVMIHNYARNLLPIRGTKPVVLRFPLYRAHGLARHQSS